MKQINNKILGIKKAVLWDNFLYKKTDVYRLSSLGPVELAEPADAQHGWADEDGD
jgi:hypothetical protein